MNIFSERLKTLRENKNLTQSQLADFLSSKDNKVLPQNISYWEKGRQPSFDMLIKIAGYFDVSTDYLIGKSKFKNFEEEKSIENFVESVGDNSNMRAVIKIFQNFNQTLSDLSATYKNQEIISLFIQSYLTLIDYFNIAVDLNKNAHERIDSLKKENNKEILNNISFTLNTEIPDKIRLEINENLRNCISIALRETMSQTGIKNFELDLSDSLQNSKNKK